MPITRAVPDPAANVGSGPVNDAIIDGVTADEAETGTINGANIAATNIAGKKYHLRSRLLFILSPIIFGISN